MHTEESIRVEPLYLELDWVSGRLAGVKLRWSRPGDRDRRTTAWGVALGGWLRAHLSGRTGVCPDIPLDWGRVSPFTGLVLAELQARVPPGAWIGYGELAGRIGRPKAARAVGRAMAANPWPLMVPCHRVLGGSGRLTGFGSGLDIKLFLLKTEGVRFTPSGLALPARFGV